MQDSPAPTAAIYKVICMKTRLLVSVFAIQLSAALIGCGGAGVAIDDVDRASEEMSPSNGVMFSALGWGQQSDVDGPRRPIDDPDEPGRAKGEDEKVGAAGEGAKGGATGKGEKGGTTAAGSAAGSAAEPMTMAKLIALGADATERDLEAFIAHAGKSAGKCAHKLLAEGNDDTRSVADRRAALGLALRFAKQAKNAKLQTEASMALGTLPKT